MADLCPTPYKFAFESIDEVVAYLDAERARYAHVTGSRPSKYYRCPCGAYHVTTGNSRPHRTASTRHRDKKNSHRRSGRRASTTKRRRRS